MTVRTRSKPHRRRIWLYLKERLSRHLSCKLFYFLNLGNFFSKCNGLVRLLSTSRILFCRSIQPGSRRIGNWYWGCYHKLVGMENHWGDILDFFRNRLKLKRHEQIITIRKSINRPDEQASTGIQTPYLFLTKPSLHIHPMTHWSVQASYFR